jgi:hypothetical protein
MHQWAERALVAITEPDLGSRERLERGDGEVERSLRDLEAVDQYRLPALKARRGEPSRSR